MSANGSEIGDLATWCHDWCIASGDARFCVLSEVLDDIDRWWTEHDERGGVPSALLEQIDTCLRPGLTTVLELEDAAVAAQIANDLRAEVASHLLPAREWVRRGYARQGDPPPASGD